MAGHGMACLVMRPQQDTATIATILAFTFCLTICIFTQTTLTHPPARRWGNRNFAFEELLQALAGGKEGVTSHISGTGRVSMTHDG